MARFRTGAGLLLPAGVLALTGVLAAPPAASAWSTGYGHVSARDRPLRPGCHHYSYHYVAKPRSNDWFLETWLRAPRGRARGYADFGHGSDPKDGYGRFGICRATVVPGRFTIKARLRWWTPGPLPIDPPVRHTRWFRPARFRLYLT